MTKPIQTRSRLVIVAGALVGVLALIAGGRVDLRAQARATPSPLDQILKEVATYNGGIESAALWKLRDYVYARKDDPAGRAECEAKLLQFLKTAATPVSKMVACRYLRLIGSDAAVPPLEAMLADEQTADMALYALRPIPGAAVDAALARAVNAKTTAGPTRIAVIGAIGERRNASAVATLTPLLQQPAVAGAAAIALGRIGGDAAAAALVGALPNAPADLKGVLASSILACADASLAAKNPAAALRLFEPLASDTTLTGPARRAAAIGRINASGSGAAPLLLGWLAGSDGVLQEAAIAKITDVIAPEGIGQVSALLPRLPEQAQVPVLAALATYPADRVRQPVLQAAQTGAPAVRLAALDALESVGDASVVPFLVELATRTRGEEQAAARATLGALKGSAVDSAVAALLAKSQADDIKSELLMAVAERRIFVAKSTVAGLLTSPSPRIRVQALKTLRIVGSPADLPVALDALLAAADDAERAEAETTAVALARMIPAEDTRSRQISARLTDAKDTEARVRLIGLFPLVGDASALPIVRRLVRDSSPEVVDAAVHAIAAWPTSAAHDDLLRLARDSQNETHRLLALRGLINSVGLDRYREPEAAVADLKAALALAQRPDERRLVLGALTKFPCQDALDVATALSKESGVEAEAQAAMSAIKSSLARPGGRRGGGA